MVEISTGKLILIQTKRFHHILLDQRHLTKNMVRVLFVKTTPRTGDIHKRNAPTVQTNSRNNLSNQHSPQEIINFRRSQLFQSKTNKLLSASTLDDKGSVRVRAPLP
ncbi:hypothetical protein HanRHA438_Chr06g0273501 [Helianthus annuus]|nr:hypothetical protein HanRHA438_Chr06g0273501 [Helianthus annuus]